MSVAVYLKVVSFNLYQSIHAFILLLVACFVEVYYFSQGFHSFLFKEKTYSLNISRCMYVCVTQQRFSNILLLPLLTLLNIKPFHTRQHKMIYMQYSSV